MRWPLVALIALLLLLGSGLNSTAALAQTTPANHDADGDGLIEISNLAQLNAVRWDLDGNGAVDSRFDDESTADTDESADERPAYTAAFPVAEGGSVCPAGTTCTGYELTASLDFDTGTVGDRTDDAYHNGGKGWLPIGSDSARFTGIFDGGGHTIANMRINRSSDYVGLFGYIGNGGAVRNLGLPGVDVSGRDYVGGLVGWNFSGTISGSYVTGTVSGSIGVGGLAAANTGTGTISGSHAVGTVSGSGYVGGLVAGNIGAGTISGSYAAGTVRANNNVGGLVGWNNGTISGSYAAGTVSGNRFVGGLTGYNRSGTISGSYATGTVSGNSNVGGLTGWNDGTINESYYDSETSGLSGAYGKTTAELTTPTGYTGIYANWNLDLDNADEDDNLATGGDDPWDFGTANQYPALKADINGDDTATWQEFGYQVRQPLLLTATPSSPSGVPQVSLSWPDVTETGWTGTPQVSYALYRDGAAVTGFDGSSRSHTDTGLTSGQEYAYRVVLLLDGAEILSGAVSVATATENRPDFGSETIDAQTYTENTDIGAVALPAATGGDGELTYTLTPELPAGLSFDAASRTITGAPTEPRAAKEYTYTATDADDDTASLTFNILVEPAAEPGSVMVSATSLSIREADSAATYTVVLEVEPTENVVITVSSDNGDVTTQPSSLTFTTDNWQTARTISVSAAHDDDAADDTATVSHTVSDGNYDGVTVASVTVSVTDDDEAGVTVSESSLSLSEGGTATYTVVLGTLPIGDVLISVFANGVTAEPTELTFTPDNWRNAQTVTVRASQDDDTEDETATIAHGIGAGSDSAYVSVTVPNVTVSITDDDENTAQAAQQPEPEPGSVTVSASSLPIREGDAAAYTVVLDVEPTENVIIAVSSDNGDVTTQPSSLTFTPGNWQTAQTVTVSAGEDGDEADDTASISHSASGGNYDGVTVSSVTVSVTDDDSDREILRDFYNATGGSGWSNQGNWLSDKPLNQWHGVTANGQGQVTGLSLRNNNLSGSLPAALGKLESLQVLSLDRNSISGALPTELGNLSNLTRLAMNRNSLSGAIPSQLGNLSNLSIIGLARNQLSGSLPASLGNLSGLIKMSLHDNTALSGALPSGFGEMSGLTRLAVSRTGLSGPLPQGLVDNTVMQYLHFDETSLCAPSDEAFQTWLDAMLDQNGPSCE